MKILPVRGRETNLWMPLCIASIIVMIASILFAGIEVIHSRFFAIVTLVFLLCFLKTLHGMYCLLLEYVMDIREMQTKGKTQA